MDLFARAERGDGHDSGCKRLLHWPDDVTTTAVWGGEGDRLRYALEQEWNPALPKAMWCMMNPSGASPRFADSTLLRTGGFSRRWGYGGQLIANACAHRATNSRELLAVADPCGSENVKVILELASRAGIIVIGHGNLPGALQAHADQMVSALRAAGHDLHVLRLSKHGVPVHPLARGKGRIPDDARPIFWCSATR